MTKKNLVLFFLSTFILSGCGRPKDYKEQAILSFEGAHAALANNNFERGVLVYGKWRDPKIKHIYRFWIKPGVDKVETVNIYVPIGRVTFYGIGADSSWNFKCDITNNKKLKPGQIKQFTLNLSSSSCSSSNDLLYNKDNTKKNHFRECASKGKLDCGKYSF